MLAMIATIGWAVLRYSANYLDGEARQGAFIGWMAATLANVLLFVLAGNLVQLVVAWIATSLCLHRLLLFYPERLQAIRGARKKFIVARISDAALAGAAVLLWQAYGTIDLATIQADARGGLAPVGAQVAAGLLAIAAVLKSVQFPTHGWLTEVVDTPTPVSALLHAGVVNGGGFLLVRFADIMLLTPGVLAVLVMIGGFTALLGGLAMLGQPAVKNSLAWSTIAQMGFMIMQCGLALFPLALLHIVAHSFYKAHAFLSSGTAVDVVAAIRRPGPVAVPSGRNVAAAFALALAIYAAIGRCSAWVTSRRKRSAWARSWSSGGLPPGARPCRQGAAPADPADCALFDPRLAGLLRPAARIRMADRRERFRRPPAPGPLEWTLLALAVASFGLTAVAQALFPALGDAPGRFGPARPPFQRALRQCRCSTG
ncbi:proton-conducting transporter membrane subunit [Novosphingobium ginsenosidimutans]|uniref:proton-conducting transporter transmembrane domain-containing protein n=1 Tax=Novosphingobium ginsenosidimutans TaxID=1176536 RepID=UPI001EE37493|nr:proton-conducting transporter membrane subunit [Novosphingobium ginsenosidimutans]